MERTDMHAGLTISSLRLGDSRQCDLIVGDEQVSAFAALSGDTNPLHMDAAFAHHHGFPRRVAHGLLALGAISRLIGTELPGPGALWMSQTVYFVRPVFVGDTLTATVTVEQSSPSTGVVSLKTDVRNTRTGEAVLSGIAKVRMIEPGAGVPPPSLPEILSARSSDSVSAARPSAVSTRVDVAAGTRVALVTGSSRGVGRAIATALANDGAHVIVHYAEREGEAQTVVDALTAAGRKAIVCRADLSTPRGAEHLFEQAQAAFGRIDILVNNATPAIVPKAVLDSSWEDFQTYLDVYVHSSLRLVQQVAPLMKERGFGRIVNVLTSYAFGTPPAKLAAYITAKSALAGLSRALAVELGPFGITVNMLAPSMVMTEQTGAVSDRARQLAAAQTPMRRLASLQDIAEAAKFLASDRAEFITGTVLPVTGGGVML